MGTSVVADDIFTTSTFAGIASLVWAELGGADLMDAGEKGGLVKGGLDKFADSEGNDSNSVIWHAVSRYVFHSFHMHTD